MFLILLFNIPPLNYFYQFFFNLLVLFYEGLGRIVEEPDMGVAVILLSLVIRILLLPLSLRAHAKELDKEIIGRRYNELKERYKSSIPLRYREEKRKLAKVERKIIISELIDLTIQIFIALMLFRVFSTGLRGDDLYLLYNWVPKPDLPFNLIFMGNIDLTSPSLQLNIFTAVLLFIFEYLRTLFSPFEPTVTDKMMQLIVPLGVFTYLYNMPAGKKLFVITSLLFSLMLTLLFEGWELVKLSREKE